MDMSQALRVTVLDALVGEDITTQISTLRKIKNHIAGHELRKREYIQQGLIPCVVQILHQAEARRSQQGEGDLSLDNLWAQAANVVTVVAHGGPLFVHPILQSTLVASLIQRTCSAESPATALPALQALNAIADNLPLSSPSNWIPDKRLAILLYEPDNAFVFARLVSQTGLDFLSHQACDAVLALIYKTCTTIIQKQILVDAGVLKALCGRLASFIVSEGFVVPLQAETGVDMSDRGPIPAAAPSFAHLSPVLEVISRIVESSKTYALAVLSDSAITAVLPQNLDNFSPSDMRKSPWGEPYFSGVAVPRSRTYTPLDVFLPHIPDVEKLEKQEDSSFPPLGTSISVAKRRSSLLRATIESLPTSSSSDNTEEFSEALLVPWLLFIVRTYSGRRRMVAGRLLVLLDNQKLVTPSRSRSFRALLAPLLVQMLDDVCQEDDENQLLLTRMPYVRAVPAVLSCLFQDDEDMQNIAVDAKAIPKLAAALKLNFDQLEDQRPLLWKPHKQKSSDTFAELPECTIGAGGPSLQARHIMTFREGLLGALAAIAPDDDHYRKEVCDQGVLTQIMLALEPFETDTQISEDDGPVLKTSGNSASTLLAACNAVRALTRSVTALRTKLVDADVSKAIVKLMHNSDPEVRIAATKVITNLVIDFSPMKSTINTSDMIKKLCQQVHSANARLRHESIWALKNLAFNADNKDKREIIDELGANWIRHLLATDPYDIPPGQVIGLEERNYATRANRTLYSTGDVIMSDDSDNESHDIRGRHQSARSGLSPPGADEDDSRYNQHTVEDDLAIQEQLFDLVRNLFCGARASEIVEYLMNEIGHNEFMRILLERLKPRSSTAAMRRYGQSPPSPRGIVHSVLGLVVHVAASAPRLRSILTASHSLMKQIANLCSHTDYKVRVQCCWIVINLTYEDDTSDRQACQRRAQELNKLGFMAHMKRLENDPTSDVRERAKTGGDQLLRAIS